MRNRTGSPVEGDDFFGREIELKSAWQQIRNGNSLILSAPRRVGKTSFAKKILSMAEEEQWIVLEINLEEIHTEKEFVSLLVEKLKEKDWWKKQFSKALDKIERSLESIKPTISYEGASASLEWALKRQDVYQQLKALLDHNKPILIMVDELTVLLNSLLRKENEGLQSVEYFLNWLRSIRQVSRTEIRWIFCSSVGIDNFTSRYKLSYTINDLSPFKLNAFDTKMSGELLLALAESDEIILPESVIETMIQKVDYCLPYFLQLIYQHHQALITNEKMPNDAKTVEIAFREIVDSSYLNTWHERLADYAEFAEHALLLLKSLSTEKKGKNRDVLVDVLNGKTRDPEKAEEIFNTLLYMLKNDGYLIDSNKGNYQFRSPLLREYWYNRFAR